MGDEMRWFKFLKRKREERPITLASRELKEHRWDEVLRSEEKLKKYKTIYAEDGIVFSAINTITYNVIMPGFSLHSDNNDALKEIRRFCERIDIQNFMLENTRNALIFGDGFAENIYNRAGDRLVDVVTRDPITFEIFTDEHGNIIEYKQTVYHAGVPKTVKIDPTRITHFKFFSLPDSPYGLSLIGANYDTINRKAEADEGIAAAIKRHGFPKFKIPVKSLVEGELPPEDVISKIANKFKDINALKEFVYPDALMDIKSIDVRGVERVEEYFNYFTSLLTAGLMVPEEILGLGRGATEATAKIRQIQFERMIKAIQSRLARIIEINIFDRIIQPRFGEDVHVSLRFRDVSPKDEIDKSKWIQVLTRPNISFEILSPNEIRKEFGYPPREERIVEETKEKEAEAFYKYEKKEVMETIDKEAVKAIEDALAKYQRALEKAL